MTVPPGLISPKTAKMLSDLLTRLERQTKPSTGPDMEASSRGGIQTLNPRIPKRILAKITGHFNSDGTSSYGEEDCRYSFVEWTVAVTPQYPCTGAEVGQGFVGFVDSNPAIEVNGRDDIEADTIVELFRSPDGSHWRFSPGGIGVGVPSDFTRPDCIIVLAQQVCCNQDSQFSGKVWYLLYTTGGTPIFIDSLSDFSGRTNAYLAAIALGYPLDANGDPTFCGECPEEDA